VHHSTDESDRGSTTEHWRRRRQQWRRGLLVTIAAVTLLAACTDDSSTSTTAGEGSTTIGESPSSTAVATTVPLEPWEARMAVVSDTSRGDPQSSSNMWLRTIHYGNVGQRLVRVDENGELHGELAESWELTEDQTGWRFHLREGIEFSNGEPFNADTVVFSLDRIVSEEFGADHAGFVSEYDHAEVVDDYTVDIFTEEPSVDFPFKLTFVVMVPPEYTGDFSPEGPMETDIAVGTGPYVIVSESPDEVVLEKRDDYWGGETEGPDRVMIVNRPEAATAVAALQAGEVDIVEGVTSDLVTDDFAYTTFDSRNKFTLQLNAQAGITANPLVREAIVNAIDQEGAREAFFGDEFSTAGRCQYVVEGFPDFNPNLENQPYDPDRARELVQEADAEGATLRLALPADNFQQQAAQQAAELFKEQLEEVGFVVELVTGDFRSYLDTIFLPPADRVELYLITSSFDTGTTQAWATYVLPDSLLGAMPFGEFPELEQLLADQATEFDPAVRSQMLADATEQICATNATLFLWSNRQIFGHAENITLPPSRLVSDFLWTALRRS